MSKRIVLTVGSYYVGFPANTDTGAVVAALANADVFHQDYCANGPKKYQPVEGGSVLTVEFVDESCFEPRKETETLMARDIEQSNKRWLDEYTKHQATQKKLKEAEERIKAIESATQQKAA